MHINIKHALKQQKGISLIELVIFIVILSVALTGITLLYINTTRYSADPMIRIRSIELAQSTLEEILLKAYDNKTPVGGGCVKFGANSLCAAPGNPTAATETNGLIAEEALPGIPDSSNIIIRASFNDVDDYHNLAYCGTGGTPDTSCTNPCIPMVDESGNNIEAEYAGFAICIRVSFAGGDGTAEINTVTPGTGTDVPTNDAKRIDVIVTDPLNSKIALSAYRLNF